MDTVPNISFEDTSVAFKYKSNVALRKANFIFSPINRSADVTQTINFSGDVSISEKWKVTYSSGYHFESGEFTQTNLGITRDIHCWTMSVNWTPFGRFQQFYFTINVKSSLLQDLKLERRKPFFDNL